MPTNTLLQPVFLIEKYIDENNHMHIILRNGNYISHTFDNGKKWITSNYEKNTKFTDEYVKEWFDKEKELIKGRKIFNDNKYFPEESNWFSRSDFETNFIKTKEIRKFNLNM